MDFEKLSAERYSLRKYSDRPVEPEKLALILEVETMETFLAHFLLKTKLLFNIYLFYYMSWKENYNLYIIY